MEFSNRFFFAFVCILAVCAGTRITCIRRFSLQTAVRFFPVEGFFCCCPAALVDPCLCTRACAEERLQRASPDLMVHAMDMWFEVERLWNSTGPQLEMVLAEYRIEYGAMDDRKSLIWKLLSVLFPEARAQIHKHLDFLENGAVPLQICACDCVCTDACTYAYACTCACASAYACAYACACACACAHTYACAYAFA